MKKNSDYHILIVDEDVRIVNLLTQSFSQANYLVSSATSYSEGVALFKKENIHLLICEYHFTGQEELALLKEVRALSNLPVIVLAEEASELKAISAFQFLADDFVSKPFNSQELILRGARLLRYFYQPFTETAVAYLITFPFLQIDLYQKRVFVEQKEVFLTSLEYDLLTTLVSRPNKVFSREDLLADVWRYTYLGEKRIVDSQITRLRDKLSQYSEQAAKSIATEWGRGYYFTDKN